ncbi:hypothetical protein RJ639_041801 [Escallonia herrerae]|uniref:Uncharacterized protein n=1 Tax=Escallonia herrerae TaxID=1293975 RepID=A0AA89B254_9ASTE|nr:hypothetical protein RJ639_041801 [Escallonia herrerae]
MNLAGTGFDDDVAVLADGAGLLRVGLGGSRIGLGFEMPAGPEGILLLLQEINLPLFGDHCKDEDELYWIKIPNDLLLPATVDPLDAIISSTYPDLLNRN